jgi:hypothetical protein
MFLPAAAPEGEPNQDNAAAEAPNTAEDDQPEEPGPEAAEGDEAAPEVTEDDGSAEPIVNKETEPGLCLRGAGLAGV